MTQHTSPIRLVGLAIALWLLVPATALALQINSAGDVALSGALVQDFNGEPTDSYFASQIFLIGTDGFTITALANDLHIDDEFCGTFGTTGNCLDTLDSGGGTNDNFDVVFTGDGVTAFGFALTALDTDWTIETYDASNVLLGSYFIPSQSPGLTGNARRGYFGATEAAPILSFTVRSAGSDRALIDDFAYVPVPEPHISMLVGLGLLVLAGSRAGAQNSRSPY